MKGKESGGTGFFLRLAGQLLGNSLGLRPREFPRSCPASPRKNPVPPSSFPIIISMLVSLWYGSTQTFAAALYIVTIV